MPFCVRFHVPLAASHAQSTLVTTLPRNSACRPDAGSPPNGAPAARYVNCGGGGTAPAGARPNSALVREKRLYGAERERSR